MCHAKEIISLGCNPHNSIAEMLFLYTNTVHRTSWVHSVQYAMNTMQWKLCNAYYAIHCTHTMYYTQSVDSTYQFITIREIIWELNQHKLGFFSIFLPIDSIGRIIVIISISHCSLD